ncbi:MAG TPA: hypothetical protein VLC51_10340 [Nitrospira sp.]|nr:hypothetical protein [Nitrospira sp.]
MSELSTLESLAELWERVDYIGLFLVFVGVIVESVVESTSLIKSSFWKPKTAKSQPSCWSLGWLLNWLHPLDCQSLTDRLLGYYPLKRQMPHNAPPMPTKPQKKNEPHGLS